MMPGQLLCMDLQSNGVVTSSSADTMGVRKKRWVRTRHLSIASSGLTAGLITVLLVLNSTNKDSKEEPNDRPVYIGAICVKSCRLIPFCVHLSNASKHVFLFNYELLFLKNIVWRPRMPTSAGVGCFIKLNDTLCHFKHVFAGVAVCFDKHNRLSTIKAIDSYTNAQVTVNGSLFKQMFTKLMYM